VDVLRGLGDVETISLPMVKPPEEGSIVVRVWPDYTRHAFAVEMVNENWPVVLDGCRCPEGDAEVVRRFFYVDAENPSVLKTVER